MQKFTCNTHVQCPQKTSERKNDPNEIPALREKNEKHKNDAIEEVYELFPAVSEVPQASTSEWESVLGWLWL